MQIYEINNNNLNCQFPLKNATYRHRLGYNLIESQLKEIVLSRIEKSIT